MAQEYKVLGQVAPSATTPTDLYTVPSGKSAVISSVIVCNRSASARTFRLSVRVAGAGADNKQYLAYDLSVPANDAIFHQLGISLAQTDVLTVYASSADLSFNAFGVENS